MAEHKIIEYFYSAHSAYAYLGAWEVERIAKEAGAQIPHRPFDFAPVMDAAVGTRSLREECFEAWPLISALHALASDSVG